VKAVVLAAGEGTRMWPLAERRPKHLLPVGGKPLLTYILEALARNSIKKVVLVVGFKGELIRSTIGDGTQYGLEIEYLEQPRRTGTASALKVAFDAVGEETFLAVYGDLFISPVVLRAVLEQSRRFSRVMAVVRLANPSQYGVVNVEADRVVGITEKPRKTDLGEGWVNAGIYVLDSNVFEAIERSSASKRAEYELTSSLQDLIDEDKEIRAAVIRSEDWLDVGRPWDLLEANERALANAQHGLKGTIEEGVVLRQPVWVEEDALVKSGSYVEGPAYIGRNSRIGPNSRIRPHTSIGDDAVIGASCEVKNSVIMNRSKVPHLSYIGDSIIGEDCNLAAGTITANIRFDERTVKMRIKGRLIDTHRKKLGAVLGDSVQTGIDVTLMPGVRIGSNSWIGPGAIVSKDVPSHQVVLVKQQIVKRRTGTSRARPD